MKIDNIEFDVGYMELCHIQHENMFMPVVRQRFPHAQFLRTPDNRQLIYVDNKSPVLGVAHLDGTMLGSHFGIGRHYSCPEHVAIFSPFVDDRLGAYTILDVLPKLGINTDILLSVGEEIGDPTSRFFQPNKKYNWMFQFDRKGTDAVHYQYTETAWLKSLRETFNEVNHGAFSDIAFMDHLNICGVNVGTGYYEYTAKHAWASLTDLASQVNKFQTFYNTYKDRHFYHQQTYRGKGRVHYL